VENCVGIAPRDEDIGADDLGGIAITHLQEFRRSYGEPRDCAYDDENDEQGQALEDTRNNSHAILHETERSRKLGSRKERSDKKRFNRLQISLKSSPTYAEALAHRARHQTVAEARYTP
jgi:hypothetical protein